MRLINLTEDEFAELKIASIEILNDSWQKCKEADGAAKLVRYLNTYAISDQYPRFSKYRNIPDTHFWDETLKSLTIYKP